MSEVKGRSSRRVLQGPFDKGNPEGINELIHLVRQPRGTPGYPTGHALQIRFSATVGGEPEIEVGLIWLLDAQALGPILIRARSKVGNEARMSKPDGRRS